MGQVVEDGVNGPVITCLGVSHFRNLWVLTVSFLGDSYIAGFNLHSLMCVGGRK